MFVLFLSFLHSRPATASKSRHHSSRIFNAIGAEFRERFNSSHPPRFFCTPATQNHRHVSIEMAVLAVKCLLLLGHHP